MRAGGGCMVQQALTFEATSVVKQAIALARRRGHAQVTPLHVASTMLSASNGIFRTACLQSHSHPLQCKALELCFNVELNRLPVSSSSPMLAIPQSPNPTISNALVAAFKRAQAHQRRGSMENQQQPLLAVKVEIEQLIISILDDPSVSRVMREAGFSSTQVKTNIEQVVSSELITTTHHHGMASTLKENNLLDTINTGKPLVSDPVKEEDIASIFKGLMIKKRRNIVVVGECLVNLENVVKQVRNKFENRDNDVPEELKDVKFISIPFSSFNNLHNHEVMNNKIQELGHLVRDVYTKGVVLYVGDLKPWMMINNTNHVVKELGKLVCGGIGGEEEEKGKCWLLGIATFATYTRCKSGQYYHLLKNRWGLHPITLPTGSLGLSLSTDQSMVTKGDSRSLRAEEETYLSCCGECKEKFEAEAKIIQNSVCESDSTFSCLPSWLKDESIRLKQNHQNCLPMGELCRKWNSICSTIHKESRSSMEKSSNFSSTAASPSSSLSFFSHDHQHPCGNLQFPFWPNSQFQQPKLTFPPFSNSTPNSRSSSSDIMEIDYYVPRFKQFNSENLHVLCNALEQTVPWQRHVLPEISGIILQCRSGMLKRKGNRTNAPDHIRTTTTTNKEETWLLFHGPDAQAKERIARELAKVVFGSYSNFVSISLTNFSSTRVDSNEEGIPNKRRRDEKTYSFIGKIAQAVLENPHRVVLVEDLMHGDVCSQMGIKRAIESGKISDSSIDHEEVSLSDAIIILCCESCSSVRSRVCSPRSVVKHIPEDTRTTTGDDESGSVISPRLNLDLNISFDDESVVEDQAGVGEMGIVESVDGLIVFRQHDVHDDLRLDVTY